MKTADMNPLRCARAQTLQTNECLQFPRKIKRILVSIDLTNESEGAIEAGIVLARSFNATLTLLHVHDVTRDPEISCLVGRYAAAAIGEDGKHFENQLKAIAEEIRKHYRNCDTVLRRGLPCEEIVKTAKELDIDIIIISTLHYNWLMRLAYGGDAEHTLRSAPCPILFLHSKIGNLAPRKIGEARKKL